MLVLLNGSALSVNWAGENVPAIVEAWYPGQAAGTAVADVLFGDVSPAGRLPVTFYRSVDQLPPFDDYSMKDRTYRYFTGAAALPVRPRTQLLALRLREARGAEEGGGGRAGRGVGRGDERRRDGGRRGRAALRDRRRSLRSGAAARAEGLRARLAEAGREADRPLRARRAGVLARRPGRPASRRARPVQDRGGRQAARARGDGRRRDDDGGHRRRASSPAPRRRSRRSGDGALEPAGRSPGAQADGRGVPGAPRRRSARVAAATTTAAPTTKSASGSRFQISQSRNPAKTGPA